MEEFQWILCPICKRKTRIRIRKDTELKNFPLFCPKCKQEALILTKFKHFVIIKQRTACSVKCPYVSRKELPYMVAGKICFCYGKVSDVRRNAVC